MRVLIAGYMCLVGFCILSAAKDIALEGSLKTANPYDYLFLVFLATSVFYIVNYCAIHKSGEAPTRPFYSDIIWLNVMTAGNWIGLFIALKYLSAPVVSALYAGAIPAATLLTNKLLRPGSPVSKADLAATVLLLVCAVLWASFNLSSFQQNNIVIGLCFVAGSSFTIAATTVYSKKLADNKHSTNKIMANRFYVLLAISLMLSSPTDQLIELVRASWILLISVAAAGTILSLWLLQKGIERCEPVVTEVVIATSPVVSLSIYYMFIDGKSVATDTVLLAFAVVIIAVGHALFQYRAVQNWRSRSEQ